MNACTDLSLVSRGLRVEDIEATAARGPQAEGDAQSRALSGRVAVVSADDHHRGRGVGRV